MYRFLPQAAFGIARPAGSSLNVGSLSGAVVNVAMGITLRSLQCELETLQQLREHHCALVLI
jgi:hypothetical protein